MCCRFTWVRMYIRSLHNAILYLRMYIRHACTMLAQQWGQNAPRGTTVGCLEAGSHSKWRLQVLATWLLILALTSTLVRYAKDKGAFIIARQDSQTDYQRLATQWVCTRTLDQLGDALANDCHYSACTWATLDSTKRTRIWMHRHRANASAVQQESEKSF